MKEWIELGYGYDKLKCISTEYKKLISEEIDGKVDLNYIRELYKKDKNIFYKLINEISLRGGKFIVIKEQNILKNINFETTDFLFKEVDEFKVKEINFEEYLLGNFIGIFNVNSDMFFNFIPIDGFKVLNKNINLKSLKEEFIRLGFEILTKEKFEEKYIDKDINLDNNLSKESQCEFKDEEINLIYEFDEVISKVDECIKNKEIENVFVENKDKLFLEFCNRNNMKFISDINGLKINDFSKCKGIGIGKINRVMDKFKNMIDNTDEKNDLISKLEELDLLNENIKNVFKQEIYLKQCISRNKVVLYDILDDIKHNFKNVSHIGAKKAKLIELDIIKFIEERIRIKNLKDNFKIHIKEEWFEKIKYKKISELREIFKINIEFGDLDNKVIEEIQDTELSYYEIDDDLKLDFIKLINNINGLESVNTIIKQNIEKVKEKELEILKERYILGKTLEEIGNKVGVTRERVRQLLKKETNNLNKRLLENKIIESIYLTFIDDTYINIDDVISVIDDELSIGVKVFIELNQEIIFNDMEIIAAYKSEYLLELNKEILEVLGKNFIIDEKLDEISQIYEIVGFKNLEKYKIEKHLIKLGYKKVGKFFTLEPFSLINGYEETLRYGFNSSVNLENEEIRFKEKYKEIFEEDISDKSIRSIEARIVSCRNILCINSKEYIHIDNLYIAKSVINLIEEFTDKMLEKVKVTTAQDILKEYNVELEQLDIKNKYKLYSIIKFYYDDKYSTGKGNSMSITYLEESNILKRTRDEVIEEVLLQNEYAIKKNDLLEIVKWDSNKLEDTISKSDKIIKIAKYITLANNKLITYKVISKLKEVIEDSLRKYGAVSTGYVFLKGMLDTNIYEVFSKYNVKSGEDIASLLKSIDKRLKGHTNILSINDSNINSISDVIINKFSSTHKKEEIRVFLKELGYKEVSIGNILNKIIDEKEYYPISNFDITYKSNIESIDKNIINEINNFLQEEFGDSEYLVVNNILGLRRRLIKRVGNIEFTWEPELVCSLANNDEYRLIKRIYYDCVHGTDRSILVKNNSDIDRFDKLVKHIIQNEYQGVKHIDSIYKFLCDKGIIYNNLKSGTMPYEILTSDLFSIDEVGRFEIKE